MYGSGVKIYIARMPIVIMSEIILYTRAMAPTGFTGAAAGTPSRGTFVVPIAATTTPAARASAWASASSGPSKVLVFYFFTLFGGGAPARSIGDI